MKGSQRMGGGRIFLKTFHSSPFKDDLSNEPNFGRRQDCPLLLLWMLADCSCNLVSGRIDNTAPGDTIANLSCYLEKGRVDTTAPENASGL